MKLFQKFATSSSNTTFLIISLFVFFLLRLPSLYEPHWYGDEGIYQVIGQVLNDGGVLYRDIWDNKPPLLYILYAVFHSDQFSLRLLSLIFGGLSILAFFFLSKKLSKHFYILTSIFIVLLGLPFLEGNIANAENFMLLPIILSSVLIFKAVNISKDEVVYERKFDVKGMFGNSYSIMVIAGFLLGVAFLFKVVAVFDFLAFLAFILILKFYLKQKIYYVPFLVAFFGPIIASFLYLFLQGAFFDYFRAIFLSSVDYVAWENSFVFPLGLVILKTVLLIAGILFIVQKSKVFKTKTIFVTLWFLFSLYSVFFTQRLFTHYLILLIPSLSLMIGLLVWEQKYKKILLIIFAVSVLVVFRSFDFYTKTPAYYQNFISFLTNGKSVVSYWGFFDRRTPTDYDLAAYLRSKIKKGDSVFIWGNNAQVYKMIGVNPPGKYIVAYHMVSNDDGFDNARSAIEENETRFIVVVPGDDPFPFSLMNYSLRIKIDDVAIYERIL